jgi:integrase
MAARKRPRRSGRIRIGNASLYQHHGSWWAYFRENGKPVRRHVGDNLDEARAVGARGNAELAARRPTIFSFEAVIVRELVRRWLGHHEQVLRSSVATGNHYRTAAEHLVRFAEEVGPAKYAHEVKAEQFVAYLRTVLVAPNGHANAAKRRLSDKGVKFILGACRSLFNYGVRFRLLPPYFENPFAALPIDRMPIDDAKTIHVFTANEEFAFLAEYDAWQFGIFYTLAKLGLRSGELTHLLVEDVDLGGGVLHIRNKPGLGWQVKTRNVRSIPLPAEPLSVLRAVVADRKAGVLLLRPRFLGEQEPPLQGMAQSELGGEISRRAAALEERLGHAPARAGHAQIAQAAWRDAGATRRTRSAWPSCS